MKANRGGALNQSGTCFPPHNGNQANEDNGGAREERKEDLREAGEARCERGKGREVRSAVKTKHKLGDFAQGGLKDQARLCTGQAGTAGKGRVFDWTCRLCQICVIFLPFPFFLCVSEHISAGT